MNVTNPILITGADRSGSSIVARVLYMCGAFSGGVNTMYENVDVRYLHHSLLKKITDGCHMVDLSTAILPSPKEWNKIINSIMEGFGYNGKKVYFYKDSGISETWPLWKSAFPDAKWIIIRRKTPDIINSCIQTGYMKRFKNVSNLQKIGAASEYEGWLWWVHQYEEKFIEIMQADVDYKISWPERMATKDFQQMRDIVEWCGLTWNEEVEEVIYPLFKR